jgi:hypothetical protein
MGEWLPNAIGIAVFASIRGGLNFSLVAETNRQTVILSFDIFPLLASMT